MAPKKPSSSLGIDSLIGDDLAGPNAYRRFLPTRFNLAGDALDAHGMACQQLACPRCHLEIARPLLEMLPLFVSIVGAPGSGKSVLQRRYEARVAESELDAARRFRLKAIAVVGVLLVVTGAVAGLVHWSISSREAQQWREQIEAAVQARDWVQAQEIVDQLRQRNPDLLAEPDMHALIAPVEPGLKAEQQRQQRFEALMAQLEQNESPDAQLVDRAVEIAMTDAEKGRVEQVRDRLRSVQSQAQQSRDRMFSESLDQVRDRLRNIRDNRAAARDKVNDLEALDTEIRQLLAGAGISPALQASATAVQSSVRTYLSSLQELAARQQAREDAIDRVGEDVGDAQILMTRIRQFIQGFPDDALSREFSEALTAGDAWQAVQDWPSEFDQWQLRVEDADVATQRLGQISEFLEQHPQSPYSDALSEYQSYLTRASHTLAPINSPRLATNSLMKLSALT